VALVLGGGRGQASADHQSAALTEERSSCFIALLTVRCVGGLAYKPCSQHVNSTQLDRVLNALQGRSYVEARAGNCLVVV